MTLSQEKPAPSWVETGSNLVKGLDVLGLRLPAQTISNTLLNGITTITPSVRYLSFRSWIIHSYIQARNPDDWNTFKKFASSVQTAIAFGNLINDPQASGILGYFEARMYINLGVDPLPLKPLIKQLGVNIYGGPSEQLGISFSSSTNIPGLTKERGEELAKLIDGSLRECELGQIFSSGRNVTDVGREEVARFGKLASVSNFPEIERNLLVDILLPVEPRTREESRLATYSLLLFLGQNLKRLPTEEDLFSVASEKDIGLPDEFDQILDGWMRYSVRDLIAAVHELVFNVIVESLKRYDAEHQSPIPAKDLLQSLIDRITEHRIALDDIGIISQTDEPSDISFRQIHERVQKLAMTKPVIEKGIKRWQSDLDEQKVYEVALASGAGCMALLPITWIIAQLRTEAGIENNLPGFDLLSHRGWTRIGLKQVIIPTLRKYLQEDWLYKDVMVDLAQRTIDQHLRVSWSRMSFDAKKDVAVLTSDGQFLRYRKDFKPGRTASRINQAVSWLEQLRLIDSKGITPDGSEVLARSLKVLQSYM